MPKARTALFTIICVLMLVLPSGVAAAAPEHLQPAAELGASWIATELRSDAPRFDQFGVVGVRADVLFALAAAGAEHEAFQTAFDDLVEGAAGYIGEKGQINAAATGKVLLAAAVAGASPTEIIEGRDLDMELREVMGIDGAFPDTFSGPNVFTQSLAVLGLAATSNGAPKAAATWLADAQCGDGAFSFAGTCPVVAGQEDPDSTGLAALALVAAGRSGEADSASGWLTAHQNSDGSIVSGFGANANSTAIGAQALRATGRSTAADLAGEFLRDLQIETGDDVGAFRYLPTDPAANAFATLQAVPGLVAGSYLDLTAPQPEPVAYSDVPLDSVFVTEIGWLGGVGITRGCNPPSNDMFCPNDPVTRGQMAAFLARALGLAPSSGMSGFADIAGSVFATDIDAIAGAGITAGCNPPVNDHFCADDVVSRGQMAAFLTRAYQLGGGVASVFVDDDNSVFQTDISRIREAGITLGCNPPVNDMFCPNDPVTRGQMAAFFFRAKDL